MAKILILEDEISVRENIEEILSLQGYDTFAADNGESGLAMVRTHMPDLVISDIAMPGLDGYEVLLEVRDHPETADIPFIFLTARADRSFRRHGMELGADDYLTKPFTPAELLSAVKARLTRKQITKQAAENSYEEMKRTFVKRITHELRTPLVSINMVLDIFSRQLGQLSPGQTQELLDSLSAGSQRFSRLVDQVVLLTQLESGTLRDGMATGDGWPIRLSDLLIAAVEMARRPFLNLASPSVRLDERDMDGYVQGDMRSLRHAFTEIITNALMYSSENDEVVIAQWRSQDQIWITITDRGVGMSQEQIEQALQDFSQIDRDVKEQQGIGIGLPLAKRIIEVHGGHLELKSVVNKGTQVTINLPEVSREAIASSYGETK